jgi:hypothetical protein
LYFIDVRRGNYLSSQNVKVTRDQSYLAGYGPHTPCMSELRLEEFQPQKNKEDYFEYSTDKKHFSDIIISSTFATLNCNVWMNDY